MKLVIWLVLLFAVAVVAAMTLGANDGLASFYWRGWRVDVSLNFFILALLAGFAALGGGVRLARWLLGLPERARAWRVQRREQALQSAQREALVELFAGRYTRSVKASARTQALVLDLPERSGQHDTQALQHILSALALHRLQNRAARDEQVKWAQACLDRATAARAADEPLSRGQSLFEGLTLLRAEWALDDRDAPTCLSLLASLGPGASRRIQAQRLRLQAHQLNGEPQEALRAVRSLSKHEAFKPAAARSLARTLAMAVLDTARDGPGLQQAWLSLDREDRQEIDVLAHAVERAGELGDAPWARRVLRLAWDTITALRVEQRETLALSLWRVAEGIEPEWLGPVEALVASHGRESAVVAMAAVVYAERQLWGKAQPLLEQTVRSTAPLEVRRDAWCRLARLAQQRDDAQQAARCFEQAAELRA